MSGLVLYNSGGHENHLLEQVGGEEMIAANQHLIIHNGQAIILDPGGHKVYSKVLGATSTLLRGGQLKNIFLSHQDPDVVAAINGWLMTTDATAYAPALWVRFIPHFGIDHLMSQRLIGIPDEGAVIDLNGCELLAIPAHFLHSPGNFQLFDPISKILYSGDLGACVGEGYREVPDFDRHVPLMEGFHRRYMTSNKAMRAWAHLVRQLPVDVIAPQHGALFRGADMVARFISWCEGLACGVDLIEEPYSVPTKRM